MLRACRKCGDESMFRANKLRADILQQKTAGAVGILGLARAPAELAKQRGLLIAGDQQAALFGQLCWSAGEAKNTYGTGCFLLQNIGTQFVRSKHRLITTLAASAQHRLEYALEGSIFIGGAVVQWLRDNLKLIGASAEVEALAAGVSDTGGVIFVPAFVGFGAPHWHPHAGGLLIGLRRDTKPGHIARAALESIAFQVADVLEAVHSETNRSEEGRV